MADQREFLVTLIGEAREVYCVEAEDAEEARQNWDQGRLVISEASSMGVDSVRLDD